MTFKVKPRIHLLTFYSLTPNVATAIALAILSHFGLSDSFKYGVFFVIALTSFVLAITTLIKGLTSELEFKDGHLIFVTELGGLADVDLQSLIEDKTMITRDYLILVDENGNKAHINLKLYSDSDTEQILEHLFNCEPV
ncbi:hypothetical protein [Glaciecola sp. MF2-115]|uniref:hypothetical protein n=1 Tax=Glaciecola sp. MF2-115 TaxID=3384827 RepID=UPI0039A356CD